MDDSFFFILFICLFNYLLQDEEMFLEEMDEEEEDIEEDSDLENSDASM